MTRRRAALLAAALMVGGCTASSGGGTPTPGPSGTATAALQGVPFEVPDGVDPAILAPLQRLGPCGPAPDVSDATPPDALGLPTAATLTRVERTDPLTHVQGWLPWTPVQLRVWYQHVSGMDVLQAEDEVFESEVLVSIEDERRLYVKAQAACEQASVFVAILAPEEAGGAVPTPAGSPAG